MSDITLKYNAGHHLNADKSAVFARLIISIINIQYSFFSFLINATIFINMYPQLCASGISFYTP